jgi:hypothetical protein
MDGRLTRRTVLVTGALAAVTAGGLLALSRVRESPAIPLGSAPDLENLPVAEVPAPTRLPVEIVYCAGWDAAGRAPVSPMSEAVARAQDGAGAQYAMVVFVDDVVRAVVEVCWSAHHAELWNVDAAGRRYRAVAYRRWPDGRLRLFGVRSWDHDRPASDRDEPTFRARVGRDENAAATTIDILAVQADGSTLHTDRDWSDWPEGRRPPENVAVPTVESWPGLAEMTGPVTVRPGPDVVPSRFPWRPPRPLRPRHLTETVTDGARFTTSDGQVLTIERVPAGSIRLPSGRLLGADPSWLDTDPPPFTAAVPPGEYPVDVFRIAPRGLRAVACRVTVTGAPVASWHLALREGDHELALGDGEFFGNPVESGTVALVDPAGVPAYSPAEIEKAMDGVGTEAVCRTVSDQDTGTDMIIVSSSGDGAYPVWLGRTEDGAVSCFVLDLLDPELATAQPG